MKTLSFYGKFEVTAEEQTIKTFWRNHSRSTLHFYTKTEDEPRLIAGKKYYANLYKLKTGSHSIGECVAELKNEGMILAGFQGLATIWNQHRDLLRLTEFNRNIIEVLSPNNMEEIPSFYTEPACGWRTDEAWCFYDRSIYLRPEISIYKSYIFLCFEEM